jgi:hypothetical protein
MLALASFGVIVEQEVQLACVCGREIGEKHVNANNLAPRAYLAKSPLPKFGETREARMIILGDRQAKLA